MSDKAIDELEADIARAREFMQRKFNAYVDEETTPSHPFAKTTCEITFPEVDKVLVCKVLYGKPFLMLTAAEYRLAWKGDKMFWVGGFLLRPDIVARIEVRDERD